MLTKTFAREEVLPGEKQWTGSLLEKALLRLAVDKPMAWKKC
jgi:hypothetical protein